MVVVVDSREQTPYGFSRFGAEVIVGTLKTGDYAPQGYDGGCCVERKEINDLIGCLTFGRGRFERELLRGAELDFFAVVCECTMEDVARGRYRSEMKPKAALASMCAFMVRYGTNFIFAGNRDGGEYTTYQLLEKYMREQEKRGF